MLIYFYSIESHIFLLFCCCLINRIGNNMGTHLPLALREVSKFTSLLNRYHFIEATKTFNGAISGAILQFSATLIICIIRQCFDSSSRSLPNALWSSPNIAAHLELPPTWVCLIWKSRHAMILSMHRNWFAFASNRLFLKTVFLDNLPGLLKMKQLSNLWCDAAIN